MWSCMESTETTNEGFSRGSSKGKEIHKWDYQVSQQKPSKLQSTICPAKGVDAKLNKSRDINSSCMHIMNKWKKTSTTVEVKPSNSRLEEVL
jgi:hypothetical protein